MAIDPIFALLVGVVLFAVEVMRCLLASRQNLEMHYYLTLCNEKGMCILKLVYASFQVMLEGKNIEEGFGIAFRVLQVWKNLI